MFFFSGRTTKARVFMQHILEEFLRQEIDDLIEMLREDDETNLVS